MNIEEKILEEVDKKISDLLQEESNTPLYKRLSGCDTLLKLRELLK